MVGAGSLGGWRRSVKEKEMPGSVKWTVWVFWKDRGERDDGEGGLGRLVGCRGGVKEGKCLRG